MITLNKLVLRYSESSLFSFSISPESSEANSVVNSSPRLDADLSGRVVDCSTTSWRWYVTLQLSEVKSEYWKGIGFQQVEQLLLGRERAGSNDMNEYSNGASARKIKYVPIRFR